MTHTITRSSALPVKKLARITGKPQQADVLRAALRTLEAATRQEPGCHEFTFFQALSDPDAFALLEEFADQAALEAHMALPHTQAFFRAQLVAGVDAVMLV